MKSGAYDVAVLGLPPPRLSDPLFIHPTLSEPVEKVSAQPLLGKPGNPWTERLLRILRKV